MKKRLFATLLALVMALGLTVTAAAEGETGLDTYLTGKTTQAVNVLYSTNPALSVEVTGYVLDGGSYKLTDNLTIDAPLIMQGNVTLDLSGHTLTYNGTAQNSVIVVDDSANFTLTDSGSGGVITGGTGRYWSALDHGTTITRNYGGGVFVGSQATFNMTGGSIVDCSVNSGMIGSRGGGVYVASGTGDSRTTFTMTGGSIVRCSSSIGGGGVYAAEYTNFTMKGGRIADCTASAGGGVYSSGAFTMEDGIIEDCTATAYGSALYVSSDAMDAQGGCVRGKADIGHDCNLKNDSSTGSTIFYGDVEQNVNSGGTSFKEFTANLVTFKNGETTYARTFFKEDGGKISQPDAPTAEGKHFNGWYTEADSQWEFGTNTVSSNMTLYAQWHDLTEVPAKGATCTEPGNTQHWKCETCGKLFADNTGATEITAEAVAIPATGHHPTHVPAKDATRQEAGNIEYWQCSGCKQCFADEAGQTPIDQADTVIAKLPPKKNPSTPATPAETVASPNTTDPGVLLTAALSVVSLLGMGYVGKKR